LSSDEQNNTHGSLLGKKLVFGTSKELSNYRPYDQRQKEYTEFIIGTDANAEPVLHTCNPGQLANYFGANPGSPHYLTPVFFRREVLSKYYSNPEKYVVSDGRISCSSLWGIRIDNNHDKYVIVYLGDLGRDLSNAEQLYWKSFNVPPDGTISDVEWKRGIKGEFADPKRADLLFKYRFEMFQSDWEQVFGWPLFKPLAEKDQHYYTAIRIPLTNDQAEFDSQILAITKLLIDSLNESEIQKQLSEKVPEDKGISKFNTFLQLRGAIDYDTHIKFLRDLQTLRSSGVGHRKGKEFEKIAQIFQIGEKDLMAVAEEILRNAILLLEYLDNTFLDEEKADEE